MLLCPHMAFPREHAEREGGKGEIEREREREKDLLGYQSADSNLGTLFNLNYLFIGPISKYSHIVG